MSIRFAPRHAPLRMTGDEGRNDNDANDRRHSDGHQLQPRQELPALSSGRHPGAVVRRYLRTSGLSADLQLRQVREAGGTSAAAGDPSGRQARSHLRPRRPRVGHVGAGRFCVRRPTEVKDLPTAVSLITRITGEDYNVVLADCRAHKTFCWVARKANDDTIERINSLKLQGIHFQKEPKRFYPARDLAAQVLGSVGMEDSGQSGIEHEFDDELRGRPGKMFISVDARRQWFADVETQPDPGDNLVLTIDKNIQYIAEKELDQAIHDTQAIAGTVIVENPHTGEILALANRPTFNPNQRKQITPGALTNRAVSYVYEPGSTFKLVTISAALEEKLTNPNEIFDCQMGSIVYNGMRIRDSKPHGLCRSGVCWPSRAMWDRSRLRCDWVKSVSTSTFAPSGSDSGPGLNCPARPGE